MLLLPSRKSRAQLLNSQVTCLGRAGDVMNVESALIPPKKSTRSQFSGFLQVEESRRNGIRWGTKRMKCGRDVPERLRNVNGRDSLSLTLVERHAHFIRGVQQAIAQLSDFSEHDDAQTPCGRSIGHLAVSSLHLSLPHSDSNSSENRQDAADRLYPRGPLNAGLGCLRVLGGQSPRQQSAESKAHRTDDQRIPAELGPFHFHSGGGDGRILCHLRMGRVL